MSLKLVSRPTLVLPRYGTRRDRRRATLGHLFTDTADEMELDLYGWQQHLADVSLEMINKRLRYDQAGALVHRQAGKTVWTGVRSTMQCRLPDLIDIRPQNVGFTAQSRISAVRIWEEHVEFVLESPLGADVAKVSHNNGREYLRWHNGSMWRPFTPSRTGARGLSLDLVVIDEGMAHKIELLAAVRPTLAQRHSGGIGSQTITVSTAGDADSELLERMTALGRAATEDPKATRCWMEWSADPDCDHLDEEVWAQVIATLSEPEGISLEFLRSEAETLPAPIFRAEYLGIPSTSSRSQIIPADAWAQCYRVDVILPSSGLTLGLDVTPDRGRAAVAVAGPVGSYVAIEIVDALEGVHWLVERTAEVALRWGAPVVVDVAGPAGSLVPVLEAQGVSVLPVTTRGACEAAAALYDGVVGRLVAHLDDHRLNDAVRSASKRAVGDRWAFDRRGGDISPLVATALAHWGAQNAAIPAIH